MSVLVVSNIRLMAHLIRHGFPFGCRSSLASRLLQDSGICQRTQRFASEAAKFRPQEMVEQPEEVKKNLTEGLNWYSALVNTEYSSRLAFRDLKQSFTYADIASAAYANHLKLEEDFRVERSIKTKRKTLHGKRIGIFASHDASFLISLLSTWLSGGIAVPLGIRHPEPMLEYFLKNSDTSVILCSSETLEMAGKIAKACGAEILPVVPSVAPTTDPGALREAILPLAPLAEDKAVIIYTSGTTGQPKGVLWKHDALAGQVDAMVNSWGWNPDDRILHVLPLYHIHGLANCLLTPLSCGAAVIMHPSFNAAEVWKELLSKDQDRVNVFMAVPTIYVRLLEYYHANSAQLGSTDTIRRTCMSRMRLMVSGSAPLPDTVFRAWKDLTGHELLERYGMTETGMILSNPLNGPRIPGTVGVPLPNMQTRIVPTIEEKPIEVPAAGKSFLGLKTKAKEQKAQASEQTEPPSSVGELQVSGPNMFTAYWNNEKATRETFSDDGWFRTGDTAEIKDGVYRLLGRTSSEIIKSGGYKISALDVERRLQEHPDVVECAVFGVPDPTFGERIVCQVKLTPTSSLRENEAELQKTLAAFLAKTLPAYSVPREAKIVEELPRNAMGKINKKELTKIYVKSQEKKDVSNLEIKI